MTQDVLISLRGFQTIQDEDAPDPVEVVTSARYYKKNGQHYLIYDEATEGFTEQTRNVIKFTDHRLMVHKKGLINVEMLFEEEKQTQAVYLTPLGTLDMGITATDFALTETEDQIDFRVDYALSMGDEFVADCQMFIKIQAKPQRV